MKDTRTTTFGRPLTFNYFSIFNAPVCFNKPFPVGCDFNISGSINAYGGISIPTSTPDGFLKMDIGVAQHTSIVLNTTQVPITMHNRAGIVECTRVTLTGSGAGYQINLANDYATFGDTIVLTQLLYHEDWSAGAIPGKSGVPLVTSWKAEPAWFTGGYINVSLPSESETFTTKSIVVSFVVINSI